MENDKLSSRTLNMMDRLSETDYLVKGQLEMLRAATVTGRDDHIEETRAKNLAAYEQYLDATIAFQKSALLDARRRFK